MMFTTRYSRHFPDMSGVRADSIDIIMNRNSHFDQLCYLGKFHFSKGAVANISNNLFSNLNVLKNNLPGAQEIGTDAWRFNNVHGFIHAQSTADLQKKSTAIAINQPGADIYGHWIIDIIPRVIMVNSYLGANLPVYLPPNTPEFAKDICSMMNFAMIFEYPENGVFWVAPPSRYHDFLSELAFANLRDFIEDRLKKLQYPIADFKKKIFVSRANWANSARALTNRGDVERIFASYGFAIIHPETLPLVQQIGIFRHASIVAGESGSGLHNSIFCKPQTKIIALQSSRQNHFIQSSLNAMFDQKSYYIFGQSESNEWSSPFAVAPKDIIDLIKFL